MPIAAASSSPAPERKERIFKAAFGMMDSNQEGEATAAFLRVREILQHHGSGFRRMLERFQELEQLNAELGRQNSELRRENTMLRTRGARPLPPAAPAKREGGRPSPESILARSIFGSSSHAFRHWDLGIVVVIIATWAACGIPGATAAFTVSAGVLFYTAFKNWFSPFRLLAGILLGFTAYITLGPAPAQPSASFPYATDDAPRQGSGPAIVSARSYPGTNGPFPSAADPSYRSDAPSSDTFFVEPRRRSPAERRSRRTANAECSSYRRRSSDPDCDRGKQWRRRDDILLDSEPSDVFSE